MHFRRELDFDDLIETIDALADEEIDEVVDWQLTESPAAEAEKASRSTTLGPNWTVRYASQVAQRMAEGIAETFAPNSGYTQDQIAAMRGAMRIPVQDASSAYTMDAFAAMPRAPWVVQQREEPRSRHQVPPRSRHQVPPGQHEIVFPEPESLNFASPLQDGPAFVPMRYQRLSFATQTMRDPMLDVLNIQLKWRANDAEWNYQQVAVSWEAATSLRASVEMLRARNVIAGRDIVVELDPARMGTGAEPLQVFIEGP